MNKKTREEMIEIAYNLQNAIIEITKKRPVRITTNREHSILRLVWADGYETRDWYNGAAVRIVIEAFIQKHGIHINEIAKSREKKSHIWLTKRINAPR